MCVFVLAALGLCAERACLQLWCVGASLQRLLFDAGHRLSGRWASVVPSLVPAFVAPGLSFPKAHAPAAAESLQSWPTLCDPTDGSPPGSPVPGILQARTLEWVAIAFSSA